MKRYRNIAIVFKLFLLSLCCNAYADPCSNSEQYQVNFLEMMDNKFYIEPETIYVSPKEILLNISGELLPIKHLFSDDGGVFVLAEEILMAKAKDGPWTCAWCGEPNDGGNYCTTCFKLRREK